MLQTAEVGLKREYQSIGKIDMDINWKFSTLYHSLKSTISSQPTKEDTQRNPILTPDEIPQLLELLALVRQRKQILVKDTQFVVLEAENTERNLLMLLVSEKYFEFEKKDDMNLEKQLKRI